MGKYIVNQLEMTYGLQSTREKYIRVDRKYDLPVLRGAEIQALSIM